MTEEQREKMMGLVVAYAAIVAAASFVGFVVVADNMAQALVYAGFVFVAAFVAIRWRYLRLARKIERLSK